MASTLVEIGLITFSLLSSDLACGEQFKNRTSPERFPVAAFPETRDGELKRTIGSRIGFKLTQGFAHGLI
jgi:hypothetical protein